MAHPHRNLFITLGVLAIGVVAGQWLPQWAIGLIFVLCVINLLRK